MTKKPNGYWTKELVQEEALKYDTRNNFGTKSSGAYIAAHRNGWLDEVCSHMDFVLKSWTKKLVQEEALKYNTRSEFKTKSNGAYCAAQRNGWLDEVCEHMEVVLKSWTKELVQEEALKYNSRTEFNIKSKGAYGAAQRNGWLDEVCSHMETQVLIDVVYMWNTVENPHIWKFGISNHYTYEKRINKVLSQTEYMLNEVLWIQTTDANKIETKLLKLGTPHIFPNIVDGKTEFRYLSKNDEQKVKAIFTTSNVSELFE